MMSNIVLCPDGSWNNRESNTNVLKIHRMNQGNSHYFPGVGTGGWFDRWTGGGLGAGALDKVEEAFTALQQTFRSGDKIYIFGFSRGAFVARMLAQKICVDGVNGWHPDIEFMGLFDTVASFGLPGNYVNYLEEKHLDRHVHRNVKKVRHALAMDERRVAFEPTLICRREGIEEVWFRGDHGDIGGSTRRASIALRWMIEGAQATGLDFNDTSIPIDVTAPIGVASGWYRKRDREIGTLVDDKFIKGGAILHYTVK